MLRRLAAFAAFTLALALSASASAAVVRDGDQYSVDLSAARICWIKPLELRDAADCEGLTPENVTPPAEDKARVIGMGLVRLEEPGEDPDLALVMVMHVPMAFAHEANDAAARDYAQGAERAIAKELRPGARMRPATDTRVTRPGKLPLIRTVLDADGIPDGADDKLVEHQIHISGLAKDGMYTVAWLTKRSSARPVEALADEAASTIAIASPAMTDAELGRRIGIVIGVVFAVGAALVAVVAAIFLSTRKRPAASSYAYPYSP